MLSLFCLVLISLIQFPNASYSLKNLPVSKTDRTVEPTQSIKFPSSVSASENPQAATQDFTLKYYYTDEYFKNPATNYNPSLATMSLCLALSSFNSIENASNTEPYKDKSKNVHELFLNISIAEEDISISDSYTVAPENNSIGVIVGHKSIHVNDEDYTLVVVGVRGGGYESEWVSNFLIGATEHHNGFRNARDGVLTALKNHLMKHKLTSNLKIWVAGFSRAAATTNLVGAAIDDDLTLGEAKVEGLTKENVYIYSFETPAGAFITMEDKANAKYNNIFNIINPSDPVPYMAPTGLQFYRYGTDLYLPSRETSTAYEEFSGKMQNVYKTLSSLSNHKYAVDSFQMHEIDLAKVFYESGIMPVKRSDASSQARFLQKFIPMVKDVLQSRKNYVDNIQDLAQDVASGIFGGDGDPPRSGDVADTLQDESKISPVDMVRAFLDGGSASEKIMGVIGSAFQSVLHTKNITASLVKLAPQVVSLMKKSPESIATLYHSVSSLAEGHFPELCYAWLVIMDPIHTPGEYIEPDQCFTESLYRQMEIMGDVEIKVYKTSDATDLVLTLNDQGTTLPEGASKSQIVSGLDENENKFIIFPAQQTGYVTITPRTQTTQNTVKKGFLSRIMRRFSRNSGTDVKVIMRTYNSIAAEYARNTFWGFDDPITLDGTNPLNMDVPAMSEAEQQYRFTGEGKTPYELKQGGNKLKETEKSSSDTYSIAGVSSNSKRGKILGLGVYPYGKSILLHALPFEDVKFLEWQDKNKKKISEDNPLRLTVTSDQYVRARFDGEEEELPEDKLDTGFIIYLVVGVVVGIIVIVVIIILCVLCVRYCFKKEKAADNKNTEMQEDTTFAVKTSDNQPSSQGIFQNEYGTSTVSQQPAPYGGQPTAYPPPQPYPTQPYPSPAYPTQSYTMDPSTNLTNSAQFTPQ